MFQIPESWILQCVTDAEGGVQNSMVYAFPKAIHSICLAHRLQTVLRHAFAMGPKDFEKDGFPEAFQW